ncbi:MAG: sensor histidine kinase, partial [Vicinamibacterales bacterium]
KLAQVPREQLAWIAARGALRRLAPGQVLSPAGVEVQHLFVVLTGHLFIRVQGDSGPRTVMEWRAGDITGKLPFSRLKGPPGDVTAEEPTEVLAVPAAHLQELAARCYELTSVLVHVMLDRARVFTSSGLLDEKLASLGRVAAGLAHELNNPASAVARTAKVLSSELDVYEEAYRGYCALALPVETLHIVEGLRVRARERSPAQSPMNAADREEDMETWLARHGLSSDHAHWLAASAVDRSHLDALVERLPAAPALDAALRYLASDAMMRRLTSDLDIAASRIHTLVTAVKGFTYLDQQTLPGPVDLARGLSDTVTVLGSKARQRGIDIRLDLPSALPPVDGFGGHLNQVWANLIDNALDAVGVNGQVRIGAETRGARVTVRIQDNGPGIPADVQRRMFDPFFTTKPVGSGTGLGLDLARRIVAQHQGEIDVTTGPAGTEFRVSLPVSLRRASGPAWEPAPRL